MLMLNCPYCGINKDETELSAGGEAHIKRFGPGSSDQDFEEYLFGRANPKGLHFERWRCSSGCGKWFHAARCTLTLEVLGLMKLKHWNLHSVSKSQSLLKGLVGPGELSRDIAGERNVVCADF